MFSICVPSYNSLDYLKILHGSLKKNTRVKYELIVHDNGSTDGTLQWLEENNVIHTKSAENKGFTGVNEAIKKAKYEYIAVFNSDMYALPTWDTEVYKQINRFKANNIDKFTISCCLIEPLGDNPEYVVSYFGHDTETFDEEGLLDDFLANKNTKYKKENTTQYSHPIVLPAKMFNDMGLFDESYFPGWSVDHDLAVEAYKIGCRNFIMLTSARVYHFISKTFTKLPENIKRKDGQDVFLKKWNMTVEDFRKQLKIAQPFGTIKEGILDGK